MKPVLSLVIPVYKTEEYIETCLSSVFSQLPEWVEVIVVNDGTPDESMHIVKENFSKWIESGQLVLLEQKNMGPGAARNNGIRKARGDFLAFLDSDDVIFQNYFYEIKNILINGVADIIEFGFQRFDTTADLSSNDYRALYHFDGLQKLSDVRHEVFAVGCWYPSTRIYRRNIFENVFFREGTHYEDLMTIPFIYINNLTVFFINKPMLGYRINPNSITAKHTNKQLSDMYEFYKSIAIDVEPDALNILKLKIARSMVFFNSELKAKDFSINALVQEVRKIRFSPSIYEKLHSADRLFFRFPLAYILVDKVRVPFKMLFSRLKLFARTVFV